MCPNRIKADVQYPADIYCTPVYAWTTEVPGLIVVEKERPLDSVVRYELFSLRHKFPVTGYTFPSVEHARIAAQRIAHLGDWDARNIKDLPMPGVAGEIVWNLLQEYLKDPAALIRSIHGTS